MDGSGNVYVADSGNQAVKEMPVGCLNSTCVVTLGGGFTLPKGVAIDGSGNVYVTEFSYSAVKEMPAGCTSSNCVVTLAGSFSGPFGVAVDGNGNVFVANSVADNVIKLDFADAPAVAFATSTPLDTTDTTDGTRTVTVQNIGNAPLTISALGYAADFPEAGSVSSDCTSSTSLVAGGSCTLSVEFAPLTVGSLSETLSLTDNTLNVAATQSISLTGTATPPTITLSPSSETLAVETVGVAYSQAFSASGGISPYTYAITITSGTMPTGLSFSTSTGVLSGTPSTSGTVSFSIVATDSNTSPSPYSSSSQSYTQTIYAPDTTATAVSISPASLISGQTANISATVTDLSNSGNTPSGNVTFTDTVGSTTTNLNAGSPINLVSGVATLWGVTMSDAGTHVITATYAGASTFAGSTGSGSGTVTTTPSSNVGTATSSYPVTVTLPNGGTVSSILVLTQGAQNLDFTDAGGDTCLGSHSAGATCTVNVLFTPKSPGTRLGAVLLEDSSNHVLATAYLSGTGFGPEVAFLSGSQSNVGTGLNSPQGVTVDGNGNVFVANTGGGNVIEVPWTGSSYGAQVTIISGLINPGGVAVDGAGNVYVADYGNNLVLMAPWNGSAYGAPVTVCSGLSTPYGVAVDRSGNVYIADGGDISVWPAVAGSVVKVPWTNFGFGAPINISDSKGYQMPTGVAVDGSGNVYVADALSNRVDKLPWNGSTYGAAISLGSHLEYPFNVAVDANGNVYIDDSSNTRVVEEPWTGSGYGAQLTVANTATNGLGWPTGVSVDARGNVYIADQNKSYIVKLSDATVGSLDFPAVVGGSSSMASITVQNVGNRTLSFSVPSSGTNPSINSTTASIFTYDESSNCPLVAQGGSAGTLAAGATCTYVVNFTPTVTEPYTGSLILTDNSLTASETTYTTQSVSLQGNVATITVTPAAPGILVGTTQQFTATAYPSSGSSLDITNQVTWTSDTPAIATIANSGTPGLATASQTLGSTHITASLGSITSAPITLTVNAQPTDVTTTAVLVTPGSPTVGQQLTVTATVADTTLNGAALSGSVTFTDTVGSTTTQLNGGAPVNLNSGVATLSNVTLSGTGTHTIAASYSGALGVATSSGFANVTENLFSNVGTPTSSYPVTVTFTAGGTVGSINVLTQGTDALDFTDAGGDTCSVLTTYNIGDTCTVNVFFTPAFAGPRYGAVVIKDGPGSVLATVYISGIGTAPQTAFGAGTASATPIAPIANSIPLSNPTGVAMDGAGDLFIADIKNSRVVEVLAGGGPAQFIAPTAGGVYDSARALNNPAGLALDGAGNLYIADVYNWRVLEVLPNGGGVNEILPTVNGAPLNNPTGIAVDGAGNLFIADTWNNRVVEILANGGSTIVVAVNGLSLSYPSGLAFDSAGNLFISDTLNNRVVKVPAGGGPATFLSPTVNGLPLSDPSGIAVDGANNLFIADTLNNRVVEVPGDGSAAAAFAPTVNGVALLHPNGIVLDNAGNLFVADHGNSRVVELQRGTATVTLGSLAQAYTGSPLSATAITNPTGLTVTFTYNGSSTVPTAAGSYAVVGAINDAYYSGTATGTLVIGQVSSAVDLTSNINPVLTTNPITLRAVVSATQGTPTGSVHFLDGTTPIGQGILDGGVATLTTSSLAVGSHSITASYIGDTNFIAATTSGALAVSVLDFTVSTPVSGTDSGSSQTVASGGTATYTLNIAPTSGTIIPSITSLTLTGLPAGATATVTPSTWAQLTGSSWSLGANTVLTPVVLSIQLPSQTARLEHNELPYGKLPYTLLGLLLLPFAGRLRRTGKRLGGVLSILILLGAGVAAMAGLSGCGAASSSKSSQQPQSYTITETITSGALSHSTTITLNVN